MSRTLYDCPQITRRVTVALFTAQTLSRAAFLTCGTVSALVAAQLGGQARWAGVPSAVLQLVGAVAALGVAALTDRVGRRRGLALGLAAGAVGTGVVAAAIVADALALFLGGLALMGVASAATVLGRFAVAEVHAPKQRGRAISKVVASGAIGSIVGPLIVGPSGRWALRVGLQDLAGPYLAALVILAASALATFVWLRPDPRDVGRKMAAKHPEPGLHPGASRSVLHILGTPAVLVAVSAMVVGQMVMVLVMVITSLHMQIQGHTLTDISLVISAHTFGMFAFSSVSGRLADRWGRGRTILVGAGLLVLACGLAPLSAEVLPLTAALLLLGLGWNLCYVGGSALLSEQLSAAERAMTQGTNELLVGLAAGGASLSGGLLFAATSFWVVCIAGALISLLPMALTARWMNRRLGQSAAWS